MSINVDFSGLEIANEEMRDYFRTRERAEEVLARRASSFAGSLRIEKVRHRLPIAGHVERDFWIIVDPDGQPI